MDFYRSEINDVLDYVDSSINGISSIEADNRLANNGLNKLEEEKKESKFIKFIKQFNDIMIFILLISAIISFILSYINQESFTDSIVIIIIVILNAFLGFFQECKADTAIDKLNKMQGKSIKVRRDDKVLQIDTTKVVVGDILILESGDLIPADARIISSLSCKVDESSLTGESDAVLKDSSVIKKNKHLADQSNMIFSGTSIVYGKCEAVVVSTGMNTELGKIARYVSNNSKEVTPLEIKISEIGKMLSLIIVFIIVIMLIIGLSKGFKVIEVIMISISLAVAAIPEGLPAVITITLSLGVSDLAKKKAIVKKLSSVETLGCTNVICTDKTGTITQNLMTVKHVFCDNTLYNERNKINNDLMIDLMILNNDVVKSGKNFIGDPTEIAVYNYCKNYMEPSKIKKKYKRIDEIPFDSDRKLMSTINNYDGKLKVITKGSFESVIDKCDRIYENGKIKKLTLERKKELTLIEDREAKDAFRIIAYAYKDVDDNYNKEKNIENKLIFVGLVCMIDPPRLDVKDSIMLCKSAHIKPIMITGDNLSMAKAIAKEIGILENDNEAISGSELDKYSKEELKEIVKSYTVYARVSPENKLDIVNAWKENDQIVAMTGDGVNDAPALKSANIGVGMGITGTEVSKECSDIILADDSFSTIVTAVKEGRRIYDNIRNVLVYLLTGNIAEVIVVFIAMLCGYEIFLPIQLLYINLITDSIPAIALAFEKESNNIMERDVRKKDAPFFTSFLSAKMIFSSFLKTIAILLIFFLNLNIFGIEIASTMSFLTLIFVEMIFAFTCKNLKESCFSFNMFNNKYLNISMIILGIIQVLLFTTPLKNIFSVSDLNFIQFVYCLLISLIIFVIDEASKGRITKHFKD